MRHRKQIFSKVTKKYVNSHIDKGAPVGEYKSIRQVKNRRSAGIKKGGLAVS
jgi:hypothetical protein